MRCTAARLLMVEDTTIVAFFLNQAAKYMAISSSNGSTASA